MPILKIIALHSLLATTDSLAKWSLLGRTSAKALKKWVDLAGMHLCLLTYPFFPSERDMLGLVKWQVDLSWVPHRIMETVFQLWFVPALCSLFH